MSLDAQIRAAERAGDQAEVVRLKLRSGSVDQRRHWGRGQVRIDGVRTRYVTACGLDWPGCPSDLTVTTYSHGPRRRFDHLLPPDQRACEDCAAVYDRDPAYPKETYP